MKLLDVIIPAGCLPCCAPPPACPPTTATVILVVSGTTQCPPSLGGIDGTYGLEWNAGDGAWEVIAPIGSGTVKWVYQCGPTLVLGGPGFILKCSANTGGPTLDFYFTATVPNYPTNPQTTPNEYLACGSDNSAYGGNATISW